MSLRPQSKKLLVIFSDMNPKNEPDDVIIAMEPLKDDGIKIITVSLGVDVDPVELEIITPFKDNALAPDDKDTPKDIARDVMKRAFNGRSRICSAAVVQLPIAEAKIDTSNTARVENVLRTNTKKEDRCHSFS